MTVHLVDPSTRTLEQLLEENEFIKESFRGCDVVVLGENREDREFRSHDVLLTDYRLIFLSCVEYSTQSSKIPLRFSGGGFFRISSIIVNATSSLSQEDTKPYLYLQLTDDFSENTQDEEQEQYCAFVEVNIYNSDSNAVYSLFNSLSETAAYMEQIEDSTNSQVDEDLLLEKE
ncbi:Regulator of volume decrease after cellular swelling family protein [Cryptosporidium felis]|nr:Regulator of volume decrease after cellular swelling family protein [Cryptosporidium felis]